MILKCGNLTKENCRIKSKWKVLSVNSTKSIVFIPAELIKLGSRTSKQPSHILPQIDAKFLHR